jgi:hypothetical protein
MTPAEELAGDRLGQRAIGSFTIDDWEAAFAQLATLAASTTNKYRQALIAMQQWGIDKGCLAKPWLAGKVIKKGGTIARRKGAGAHLAAPPGRAEDDRP